MGDVVTATIDGKVVTFTNEYAGKAAKATPSPNSPAEASNPKKSDGSNETAGEEENNDSSDEPKENVGEKKEDRKASKKVDTSATGGDWERTAYYCASSQTAEGIVFLNNRGKFDL